MNRIWKKCVAAAACGMMAANSMAADIVDTAVGAGNFKTLAAALGAADLVGTLKGKGPFTVFAPTDEAFAKLPAGTIESLLKAESKGTLAGILTYHVVPGKVLAKQVVGLSSATTVNGQRVDIKVADSKVMVDGASVTSTDIQCDNGVIHVIDSVLLPESKNIPEVASGAGTFSTLLAAAGAAGLVETLSGKGPLTVFAPTDEAFAKLPEGTVASLLKPENKQKLVDILKYHVVAGRVYSDDALKAKTAKTVQGSTIAISSDAINAKVNTSKLLATDIDASNGVIHVIDAVLMPPAKTSAARQMLQDAVTKGATLYNSGHHSACADVYEDTMKTLMSLDIDSSLKTHMASTLSATEHQSCQTSRAWALRKAIDQTYTQLSHTK